MDQRDIPVGLNRIKTSRARPPDWSSSGGDDSPAASGGVDGRGGAPVGDGDQRIHNGFRKEKKIGRWFSSYLINKASTKSARVTASTSMVSEKKSYSLRHGRKELVGNNDGKSRLDMENSGKERPDISKFKKGQKTFSHELGLQVPQSCVTLQQVRTRSYSDLEDMLGSLHSMYDAAKEEVDAELASILLDIQDVLEDPFLESREAVTDLMVLVRQCREMPSDEFRERCGETVQNLAERRKQCLDGLLKQLFTRILFILTRCSRLLQLQNNNSRIYEDSIHKFKQCLASIPTLEKDLVPKLEDADVGFCYASKSIGSFQCIFQELSEIDIGPENSHYAETEIDKFDSSICKKLPLCSKDAVLSRDQGDILSRALCKHEELSLDSDIVICRICEENIPINHLESHSYICAYAEKCDLEGMDVDERLLKAADMLEQIVDSYDQNFHSRNSTPDTLRTQKTATGTCSPKIQEWHNRGAEGMFEDLHQMDTSFIDESQLAFFTSLKTHVSVKSGSSDVNSSGSITPVSSATTPRTNHFDLFWLEYNNPSEQEDVNQMKALASVAYKVANFNLCNEKAPEYLNGYINDLQNIMQKSKLRALIIDTFGSRIMNLLKEKYLLAVKLTNTKPVAESQIHEVTKCNNEVESQTGLLNSHLPYKERMSIDDFKIIKPISRGAFGKVFLARKRTTGDLFAIKVLKKVNMIRKNDIERILAERNILITVRNPFVVRFFYSFTCRDSLYLVMEYLNGGDLYSLLRKVGCLEEDVARIYTAELVLALEYLHSLGIVHRDLKPDNVLVAQDGHIKLTDFGLSKIGLLKSASDLSGSRTNNSVLSERKRKRSAMGTPDYLAPEILLGTEHGFAADWWSVGIILFEFITGIPPFASLHPEKIFDNILNRRIPWPDVPKDMSNEAKDLIDRLLIQDPNMRLGANGASEVKMHPFFRKIDWRNLASQKATFIPNPESADDTSYFMPRYSLGSMQLSDNKDHNDFASGETDSSSNDELEVDECNDLKDHGDMNPLDILTIKFSFKSLSQLATMNHDALVRSGKTSKCSSPVTRPSTPQTD